MSKAGSPNTIREQVDISKKSSELGETDHSSLVELKHKNSLEWFQVGILQLVSAFVILAVMTATLTILVYSEDGASRDWARQTLSALMGFAAGGIWHSQRKKR